jgi:hypothetical protein
MNSPPSRIRSWGVLVRLPNLFTVPGDAVAGYVLAGAAGAPAWWPLGLACGSGLFLYTAGLLLNDLFDIETDRTERPGRPLPSGAVSLKGAAFAGGLCLVLGNLCACAASPLAGLISVGLAALILLYNMGVKRVAVVGEAMLGGCRVLNFSLGAAAVGGGRGVDVLAVAGVFLYIFSVSLIARHEIESIPSRPLRWAPATVLLATMVVVLGRRGLDNQSLWWVLEGLLWGGLAVTAATLPALAMGTATAGEETQGAHLVPSCVGRLLRAYILFQAFLVVSAGTSHAAVIALILAALYVPAVVVGKWFYGS